MHFPLIQPLLAVNLSLVRLSVIPMFLLPPSWILPPLEYDFPLDQFDIHFCGHRHQGNA